MKAFLAFASIIIILLALSAGANAKDHGRGQGKGHGNGHYKHKYKKPKHYCSSRCHHGHHIYRERVIVTQPAPRPGITISIPL
jgi:hypothetical protein